MMDEVQTPSALELALAYREMGWAPIDLPPRSKNPGRRDWQNERWERDQLQQRFTNGSGVGILLGRPSDGLVDVDLDCAEAIVLAAQFLPRTPAGFGRLAKPRSHWLYSCDSLVDTVRFQAPDGTSIVELRSTGGQTVFPPSLHPSGS